MSTTRRYIDIDSSFRDRNRFTNPAQFDVLISQSGRRSTVYNAIDPVSVSTTIFPPPNLQLTDTYNSYSWMYPTSQSPLIVQIDGISVNSSTSVNYMNPHMAENYYINKIIENISDGSFRRIIDYHTEDVITHYDTGIVDVSMTTADVNVLILGATTAPFTFHSDVSNYYVGKYVTVHTTPEQTARIVAYNPSDPSYGNLPVITVTPNWQGDASALGGVNYTIYTDKAYYITLSEQFSGGAVSTSPPVLANVNETQYRIRGDIPYEVGIISSASTNTFILPPSSSAVNGFYNGMFLWIPIYNKYYLVTNYNGSTRTGTISSQFYPALSGGEAYNIIQFTYDNFFPLVYTGAPASHQQMTCYEIELVSLILPNTVLSTGFGNLIAFYPHVYVEFCNISAMNPNIIYSNNPYTSRVLFKVPIDDINTPETSSFVSVDGHSMVQTIKFKPNDHFRFSVILPNGELFKTEEQDYLSPSPPNPNVQISATFSIKRLEEISDEGESENIDIYPNHPYLFMPPPFRN